jgi:hypothetical protein
MKILIGILLSCCVFNCFGQYALISQNTDRSDTLNIISDKGLIGKMVIDQIKRSKISLTDYQQSKNNKGIYETVFSFNKRSIF